MRKLIITAWAVAAVVATASAQRYGGWLTNVNGIATTDMMTLSQWNWSLGTACSAAMGGAVSALGADISAIAINPAGLGVYRRGAFSVSGAYSITDLTHDQLPSRGYDYYRDRFALNSVGGVFVVDQRSSGLVSSSIAITYNKLADFHTRTRAEFGSGEASILDLFTLQLNGLFPYLNGSGWNGLATGSIGSDARPFQNESISPREWGAVLSYLTFGVNPANKTPGNTLYRVEAIMQGAEIRPAFDYNSNGFVGQYDFSWGGNINNTLYVGVSVGLQDIRQEQEFKYTEEYDNNFAVAPYQPGDCLKSMTYDQTSRTTGVGFNARFGVIYRPVPELRISLAYHTPTVTALRKEYEARMATVFMDGSRENNSSGDYIYTEQSYSSPSRLIVGAAYTFGNKVAISADWERVMYGGMRVYGQTSDYRQAVNGAISDYFKAANNFRVGVEVKATAVLAIRGGFAYYGSPLKDDRDVFNAPLTTLTTNISAGVGYTISRNARWNFAYVLTQQRHTMTDLYYYTGEALWSDGTPTGSAFGEYTKADPLSPAAPMDRISTIRHGILVSYTYSF